MNINKFILDFKLSPCSESCMLPLGNSLASEFYMQTFRNTLFYLHRRIGILSSYEDGTECSETSAYTIQTPGIYPE